MPLSLRHIELWPYPFPAAHILSACLYHSTLSLILPEHSHVVHKRPPGVLYGLPGGVSILCAERAGSIARAKVLGPPSTSFFACHFLSFPFSCHSLAVLSNRDQIVPPNNSENDKKNKNKTTYHVVVRCHGLSWTVIACLLVCKSTKVPTIIIIIIKFI